VCVRDVVAGQRQGGEETMRVYKGEYVVGRPRGAAGESLRGKFARLDE